MQPENSANTGPEEETYLLPASMPQARFWGLDRQRPGNPTWNLPVRYRLEGALDASLIEKAFQEIVRRHEPLRAHFQEIDGQLMQVIQAWRPVEVPVTDLRHLPKAAQDAEVDRLSFEEARRSFDLEQGPLLRVQLLRTGNEEHLLLVTPHHSVADYWSVGMISNEMGALYEAYTGGRPPVLPELKVQYGDYAVWQHEQAGSDATRVGIEYWKRQLRDLPLAEFPTDRPRPPEPTFDANITSLLLPVELTNALRDIANREGATFFNFMLAAFALVVRAYTGKTDFGIGTQVAGRNSVELEPLIGLFINNVVLRPRMEGDPAFVKYLASVNAMGVEALEHQDVRFEQVLKELRPEGYPSFHSLFRVNFICQRDPVKPIEFSGIRLTVVPSKSQGALYELNVFLVLRTEGWRLACEYNTDLFDSATMVHLLEDYRSVLEAIVADPHRPISELARVGPAAKAETKTETAAEAPLAAETGDSGEATGTAETCAFPMAIAQERFWQLDQLAPGNAAMNMPMGMRLRGALDVGKLEQSIQALMVRHEALRTTFAEIDGVPRQIVHPSMNVAVEQVNLRDLHEAERQVRAQQLVHDEALRPFTLTRGPLVRVTLIGLDRDESILLVTMPHILCDGWSNGIFIRELAALYRAAVTGTEAGLEPLPIQFADFACWQQEWLKDARFEEDLEYWRTTLGGNLPVLDLPADRPPEPGLAAPGHVETTVLPAEQLVRLKELCRREEATPFMLFLTAWMVLLHQYTGAEDLLAGSPVAGRNPETENLIGLFSYPISLRVDLSGAPTFREALGRVRDATLGALSHKDLPFERLAAELKPGQVRGRNPLFQIYFLYQVAFLQPMEVGGSLWTPLVSVSPGTPFDLSLGLLERPEGVVMRLEFKPGLFDATRMRRALRHLRSIVDSVEQDMELPVGKIPLEGEVPSTVAKTETPHTPLWRDPTEGFWSVTEQNPDKPAIVTPQRNVSYGELGEMAGRFGAQFSSLESAKPFLIGLCVEDPIVMTAAALGALDAGVPFAAITGRDRDKEYLERLRNAGMVYAIGDHKTAARLKAAGIECLPAWQGMGTARLRSEASAHARAEIRITARREGRAAGISTRALIAQMENVIEILGFRPSQRVALLGSNFRSDEYLAALASGCTILSGGTGSNADTVSWAVGQHAEVLALPASWWRDLIRLNRPLPLGVTRIVGVRGISAPGPALSAWRQIAGTGHRWIGLYGTAEAGSAVAVEDAEWTPGIPGSWSGIFSRTAARVQIRVLDRYGRPVPTGIPGELCLTGAAVDGPPGEAGGWLRTGDKAIPQGTGIQLLGPENGHLNLGGFRVSSATLEAFVERHPVVRSACVLPIYDERQRPQIVVAVEVAGQRPGSEGSRAEALKRQIRAIAEERLGRSAEVRVTIVESLPRMADGRPDRDALLARHAVDGAGHEGVAPRDAIEARLAEIWQDLFGIERAGVRDSFFDLGGTSLAAVRLFKAIDRQWGKRLPLSTLFHAPTIEQLAEILREERMPKWSSLVEVQRGGLRPPLYIISGLGGNVVRFRDLARRLGGDQPVFALQPPGLDGKGAYLTTLEEMAGHYIREIRREQPMGPYHIAGYSFGGLVTFEMASQLAREGEPAGLVALLDAPEWNYNKQARSPRTAADRWRQFRERMGHLFRGPERVSYLTRGLRSRVTDSLFRLHEFLHLPIPQWCASIEDVNRHAARRYVPKALPGKLTLFRTVRTGTDRRTDLLMGWGRLADAVEVHEVPGDHMDMTAEPHVQVLAEKLRQTLETQPTGAGTGSESEEQEESRLHSSSAPRVYPSQVMNSIRLTT